VKPAIPWGLDHRNLLSFISWFSIFTQIFSHGGRTFMISDKCPGAVTFGSSPQHGEESAATRHINCICNKRGTDSLVNMRRDQVPSIVGKAARAGLRQSAMRITHDKRIDYINQLKDRVSQGSLGPSFVFESADRDKDRELTWQLVEITCSCPWTDHDGETLELAHMKKVDKYDRLREEIL
jgi:hypothetical protein